MFVPVIEQNGYIERKIIDLRLVVVVPKKMSVCECLSSRTVTLDAFADI